MKVKDLIRELEKCDENLHVVCYAELEVAPIDDGGIHLLAIESVGVSNVVLSKDPKHITRIEFDTERGDPHAVVQLTGAL